MTVVTRDPEYTPVDLARLLAARRVEQSTPDHGIPMAEAMDPANQYAFEAPDMPDVDWAAKVRKDKQDAYYNAWPDANRNGHRWGPVTRRGS